VEAIPAFDRALEDDVCRPAAEEGLRRLGVRARNALLLSAATPLPDAGEETPSSLRRRRSVFSLLVEAGIGDIGWMEVRPLLPGNQDPEITVRLAQLAALGAVEKDRRMAAERLVTALSRVPWYVQKEAENALVALAPESTPFVEAEHSRRGERPPRARASDETLRVLTRVRTKLLEADRCRSKS
jgi:hypothetical protein